MQAAAISGLMKIVTLTLRIILQLLSIALAKGMLYSAHLRLQ